MGPDDFSDRKTGSLVAISSVAGVTHAFVPDALPAGWQWPNDLWPLLYEAGTALSRLDGIARTLPNPELLLRPLQNREAARSSSLEGTTTDPQQQALFRIEPRDPSSADDPANAHKEVLNYREALLLRERTKDSLPLSLRLIRELHRVLMDGVRGQDKNPGEFRTTQNQIGRPARFVPPPPQHLTPLLSDLEKYLHAKREVPALVAPFLVHYQFEAIHPFRDGNGRVGRLLLAILIQEWCSLSNQWLYMSAYFETNKDEYIDRLLRVSTNGEWSEWVAFCLRGVVVQASDTERRCSKLLSLQNEFREMALNVGGSVRLSDIIDELFDIPVVHVAYLAKKYEVAYNTARADLEKLEDAGVIEPLKTAKQKAFYCPKILDITYAD